MSRGRVYISGAIMYASDLQKDLFRQASEKVSELYLDPVDPRTIAACEGAVCLKQPHEMEKKMEHSWSCYMRYDLIEMLKCDRILMLPGWSESHGARLEHQVAIASGLGIMMMDYRGDIQVIR